MPSPMKVPWQLLRILLYTFDTVDVSCTGNDKTCRNAGQIDLGNDRNWNLTGSGRAVRDRQTDPSKGDSLDGAVA